MHLVGFIIRKMVHSVIQTFHLRQKFFIQQLLFFIYYRQVHSGVSSYKRKQLLT